MSLRSAVLALQAKLRRLLRRRAALEAESDSMAARFQEILQGLAQRIPQGGGGPMMRIGGVGAIGLAGLAYGGGNMIFNVEGGHRAVMFHRFGGVQQSVRAEGTHLIVPWFQRPIVYDVRARPRIIQAMTGSHGETRPLTNAA